MACSQLDPLYQALANQDIRQTLAAPPTPQRPAVISLGNSARSNRHSQPATSGEYRRGITWVLC